jgi:hypothetical protein
MSKGDLLKAVILVQPIYAGQEIFSYGLRGLHGLREMRPKHLEFDLCVPCVLCGKYSLL